MKKLKNRILATLGVAVLTTGMFPCSAFAEEIATEFSDMTIQYESPSTFTLSIPATVDITSGNCLGVTNANLASDKEIFVRLGSSSFNENGGVTMSQINNESKTINVTIYNYLNEALSTSNPLLCVFNDTVGGDYSTFFYGQCTDSNVQAGKYRATVTVEAGIRDKQQE